MERLNASDHYTSPAITEIEDLRRNNAPALSLVNEYIAIISAQALRGPDNMSKKDLALVQELIALDDPDFNLQQELEPTILDHSLTPQRR